jgi:transketolase
MEKLMKGRCGKSFLLLNKYKLNKVISIIDRNTIQIDGYTEDVLPLESLTAKMEAFNFQVIDVDGHNFRDIMQAIGRAKSTLDKPTVIIAHTIPGKGVTAFEGDYRWHGKAPNEEEGRAALKELRSLKGKVHYGEL